MDIEYVSKLARLRLSNDEKEQYANQLKDILKYIEKLNQLDTKGIAPMTHVVPMKNVVREDKVTASLDVELVKKLMPESYEGFFKVPPVIE